MYKGYSLQLLFAVANDCKQAACPQADNGHLYKRKLLNCFKNTYFLYFNM